MTITSCGSTVNGDGAMNYELQIAFSLFVDLSENCTFQPLQTQKVCTINLRHRNEDFQNDTVPGVVRFEHESTPFCNLTEKEVVIHKCE